MRGKVVTRTQTAVTWVAYCVIAIAIAVVLYIAYLLLAPVDVLTVKEPLPVSPTNVQAGGTVDLKFDYCKRKPFESNIRVDFIGDYVVPPLSTFRNFPTGCHQEHLLISIPTSTPDGQYTLRLEIDYDVNPLKQRKYRFESVQVVVDNQNDKPQVKAGSNNDVKEHE